MSLDVNSSSNNGDAITNSIIAGLDGLRVGVGWDIHAFAENRKLILGGVEIDYHLGLLGHSDADVLCHAIMDALLGASGQADIGQQFPDHDSQYLNADSSLLLAQVYRDIRSKGWRIINIDTVIICQKPRITSYRQQIIDNLCTILNLNNGQINMKATTSEKLGFTGRAEGIAVETVCLLYR